MKAVRVDILGLAEICVTGKAGDGTPQDAALHLALSILNKNGEKW